MADSRHGKHDEDKVQFGGMVTPEFKALAQLTANACHCSMMDLMMNGVKTIAVRHGIMVGDKIAPAYRETVESLAEIIRVRLRDKRWAAKVSKDNNND